MILSINPTYYCNFRCDFCYLTKEQLSDPTLLPLNVLEEKIKEVLNYQTIDMVDLYGGEVGLLQESYIYDLIDLLERYEIFDINIITNLSMLNNIVKKEELYLTVSYDFDCREQHERVWNNMASLNRPFSILILASEQLINKNVDDMILQLNLLKNLQSVEIKPYSTNQANCHNVTFKQFEEHVKKWITSSVEKKFQFVNEKNIIDSIQGKRNSFSNDHVYITPSGDFAVLEFDLNDNEYFKNLNSFTDYIHWAESEPEKNTSSICKNCEYFGKCLTEHYRYVKTMENGCNGFKGLIDWYRSK